jgi:hypothetical protein
VKVAPAVQVYIVWYGFWCCCRSLARGRCICFVFLVLVVLDLDFQRLVTGYAERHVCYMLWTYVCLKVYEFATLAGIEWGQELFGAKAGRAA